MARYDRYGRKIPNPIFAWILWSVMLVMLVMNLFGADIPWLVVFAPVLFQLAILIVFFAIVLVIAIIANL